MKQDNVTPIFLPNFGYLMRDIPNELFEKLKKESFEAESIRKTDFLENEFVSGLSGSGVVKHFYVKDSLKELNEFVLETFLEYDKVFNYLQTIITLSNPVDKCSKEARIQSKSYTRRNCVLHYLD